MKKRALALILCVAMIGVMTSCGGNKEEEAAKAQRTAWNSMTDQERMVEYNRITRECLHLWEELGRNTPYPAFWRNASMRVMIGNTVSEAVDYAQEAMIRTYAVYALAQQKGISDGPKDVEAYIQQNILDPFAEADNSGELDAAAEEAGTTFEDSVWAYYDSYRWQYILSQIPDYKGDEDLEQYEEAFKKTDSGKELEKVLDVCKEMFCEGEDDETRLKAAAIYFVE